MRSNTSVQASSVASKTAHGAARSWPSYPMPLASRVGLCRPSHPTTQLASIWLRSPSRSTSAATPSARTVTPIRRDDLATSPPCRAQVLGEDGFGDLLGHAEAVRVAAPGAGEVERTEDLAARMDLRTALWSAHVEKLLAEPKGFEELERARMHHRRAVPVLRARPLVDQQARDLTAVELRGEEQSGRTGTDDEHRRSTRRVVRDAARRLAAHRAPLPRQPLAKTLCTPVRGRYEVRVCSSSSNPARNASSSR